MFNNNEENTTNSLLINTINYGSLSTTTRTNKKKKDQNDYVIHQITGGDTLEGLAIKYNVQPNDIKRVNNIWNSKDIYALKNIYIPKTKTNFERELREAEESKQQLISRFLNETQCVDPQIALKYLEDHKFFVERAIIAYSGDTALKQQKKNLRRNLIVISENKSIQDWGYLEEDGPFTL
eukprot:TRINITY_DN6020_c0_g1_i1.p1 TRINITY_DN6020_c0_g1~~TRINITY_DN6020_c0_g1_i1.p1  ORF type:complete len:180 (-),score=80.16 TRINITY_DN6020_c0_g1_i1:120-659(-)